MERGILSGLAAFRWVGWAWMATVLLLARDELVRSWLAVGLVGLALVLTIATTVLLRTRPLSLTRPALIAAELATGMALVLCDGWAYGRGHAFSTSQSLGVAWPLAGVLNVGVTSGAVPGTVAGVLMGGARLGATVVNGTALDELTGQRVLSLASSFVLYAMAGGVSGYVAGLLRRAERQVSAAQAREEMARHLHDGVLQTLTVVERRAEDPTLVRLAREQQRELREYLRGLRGAGSGLAAELRSAAARHEDVYGGRVEVVVADDLHALSPEHTAAVAGAVGEAMTNAGKHAGAQRITVYLEPADAPYRVFCSVKDDGPGFDVVAVEEGSGLTHSVRERITELGGRVEVESAPGAGTEVRLWVP